MSTNKRPDKTTKIRQVNRTRSNIQLGEQPQQTSNRFSHASAMQDLQRVALGTRTSGHPINFGKPFSFNSTNTPKSSGGDWSGLVQKAITDGASQILGGGPLGSDLSSAFSALVHLFGGGTQMHAPVLEKFSLPAVEQRTIDTAQNAPTNSSTVTGSYQSMPQNSAQVGNVSGSAEQAAVVKAIRNALLTSSSLNDIIGEL